MPLGGGIRYRRRGSSTTVSLAKGAYVGAADPAGITAFDAATDTRSTIAADYLPADSGWRGLEGTGGSLRWLLADGWTQDAVHALARCSHHPDRFGRAPGRDPRRGATGAYNAHFVTLARTLMAAGESDAYLRLGWEFDGTWTAWKATTPSSEANYAAYFRQIVTAIRSVPGEHFRFVWNPDAIAFADAHYDVGLAYPGNRYVNVVGLDTYDQSWVTPLTPANAWNQTVLPSLTAAQNFAHRAWQADRSHTSGARPSEPTGTDSATTPSMSPT